MWTLRSLLNDREIPFWAGNAICKSFQHRRRPSTKVETSRQSSTSRCQNDPPLLRVSIVVFSPLDFLSSSPKIHAQSPIHVITSNLTQRAGSGAGLQVFFMRYKGPTTYTCLGIEWLTQRGPHKCEVGAAVYYLASLSTTFHV